MSDGLTNKSLDNYITADELDSKLKPHDTFQVLDADSSQQEAIEIVKSGRSLVLQGPPGTGKSQTIVNLISELLANGKKILFVCEKMAALDVVYDRLKTVELDRFCLQIHSRKANKKDVLNQLKSAFEYKTNKLPSTTYLDELLIKKEKLNLYVDTLHKPFPQLDKSPYWILGQLNTLKNIEILNIDFEGGVESLDSKKFIDIIEVLETFKIRIEEIGKPIAHPYWGIKIDSTSESHKQRVGKLLVQYIDITKELILVLKEFKKITGINVENISDAKKYCSLVDILSLKHDTPKHLVSINDPKEYFTSIKEFLTILKKYQKLQMDHTELFEDDFLQEIDFKTKKRLLKGEFSSLFRYFKSGYWSIKREIKGFAKKDSIELGYKQLLGICNNSLALIKLSKNIEEIPDEVFKPLGELWEGKDTIVENIELIFEWLIKYRDARVADRDDHKLLTYIVNSDNLPEELSTCKESILKILDSINSIKKRVDKTLDVDDGLLFEDGFENEKILFLHKLIFNWNKNIDSLVEWTRYRKAYYKCDEVGLGKYIDELVRQDYKPELIVQQFKKKYYYEIFQLILREHDILSEFESLTHQQLVDRFVEIDRLQLEIAKARVLYNICKNKPDQNWSSAKSSGLGILQKQFRLSRRHMALRRLFKKAPTIIQKICPCFMMSPMSVAQYLDPEKIKFDVVIFDEASQIKPEHSVGAIVRGEQLVVVGDEKQLPPTSFFQKGFDAVEDEEDLLLDSILDECMTIDGVHKAGLRWHYRSKDESLIQFSNVKYYDNYLFTFPNATSNSALGVQLHYLKDTVYDRGKSATNKSEAIAIINHVIEQFKKEPNKSIGVVALSQGQQAVLRAEKDKAVIANPSLQQYFDRGDIQNTFFIKNLETVQGDERDIIYISVGYGRDKNNKISMNFGPLNKEGGERRLNVLVSRAREKVNVFSSITGDDINLSRTQSIGVKYLKDYLDYAKSGGDISTIYDAIDYSNDLDIDNPFEVSVSHQLELANIKAIPQVGQSGYKIDFGILDPDDDSKFLLAVECDGASYHSCATARDRARLRQGVLENLGWRFHRIWSTDWFQNHKREMEKLKEAIKKAKNREGLIKQNTKIELDYEDVEETQKSKHEINILDYQKYSVDIYGFGWAEEFYTDADSTWSNNVEKFNKLILDILDKESPMHFKQLSLRVIEHYSMGTVGSRITRIMNRKLSRLEGEKSVKTNGDFIYKFNQKIDFIRVRVGTDMDDNVLYISPDEIKNAIIYILEKEFTIPKNELIIQVARLFKYEHTGKRIKKYFGDVIEGFVDNLLGIDSDNDLYLKQ